MPTATPVKETADERTVNDRQMFARLREIRAGVQDIQKTIVEARKRALATDAAKRTALLLDIFSASYLDRIEKTITPQMTAILELFDEDVKQFEWAADNVTVIRLTWARAKDLWPTAADTAEVIDQKFTDLNLKLDQIIYQCGTLTLSPRVNDVLNNLRTGQALDFNFEFGNEMPTDPALGDQLFLELAQQGGVFTSGVIDVDARVIYKAASSRHEQQMSVIRLALYLLVGGIVIPAAIVLAKSDWSWVVYKDLIKEYILIFAGAGAHLAVNALKESRAKKNSGFQAVDDWVLWLHVREVKVLWGFAYVWLGCILLTMTAGIGDMKMYSAFFAGYSIDSIVEVFLGRFETIVKTNEKTLTALGGTAG